MRRWGMAAALVLATAGAAAAQSARSFDMTVARGDDHTLKLTWKSEIRGMPRRTVDFRVQLYRGRAALPGTVVTFQATPAFPVHTYGRVFCAYKRADLDRKLGQGAHALTAWVTISGSGRRLGSNGFNFRYTSSARAAAAPTRPPATGARAWVRDLVIDPDAQGSEALIAVTARLQVIGRKGAAVTFRCRVLQGRRAVGFVSQSVRPGFDNTVYNTYRFRLRRAYFAQRVGAGTHALTAEVAILDAGGAVLASARQPFRFTNGPSPDDHTRPPARRTTTSPRRTSAPRAVPPPAPRNAPTLPGQAEGIRIQRAIVARLRRHPSGQRGLGLDPELLGPGWFCIRPSPNSAAISSAFTSGRRNNLLGHTELVFLNFQPDGTGMLTIWPVGLVLQGPQMGHWVLERRHQKRFRIPRAGVTFTNDRQGNPVTFIQMVFDRTNSIEGLYIHAKKTGARIENFRFLMIDPVKRTFDERPLLFLSIKNFDRDFAKVRAATLATNQRFVRELLKFRRLHLNNQIVRNNLNFNIQMSIMQSSHQANMNIIANMR